MKALQKLHNDVLVGKVRKTTFLTESKKHFPNLFSNQQPYEQIVQVLVKKGYIKETLTKDYVSQHEFHIGFDIEMEKCQCPEKAEAEVLKNLTKDVNYYTHQLANQPSVIKPQKVLVVSLKENKGITKGSLKKLIKEEVSKAKFNKLFEDFSFEDDSFENSNDSIFEDHSGHINDPQYEFYAVLNGKLINGYQFKEDALDFKNEYVHKPIKIVSKKFLISKGVNPDDSKFWGQSSDLEEIKTNLFEAVQDPFEEEFKSPTPVSPELQKLATDIRTAINNNKEFKGLYDSAYSFAEQKDDTWRELMNTLAKKLYNYLASVKTYVDTISKGDFSPIVKILTTSTALKESKNASALKLSNIFN